jgi:hypothetical protein
VGSQERKEQMQVWTEYELWCAQIEDFSVTVRAEELNMNRETVQLFVKKDLEMRKISAKNGASNHDA